MGQAGDMLHLILHRIPRPLYVLALRTAHWLRLRWWRVSGAQVSGVRVVVIDPAQRVLLIRHSYGGHDWMLPGGGMKRGEDACEAAAREVFEEAGLVIEDKVEIGLVTDMIHGSNNDVRVVAGWSGGDPRADLREITHAEFFALNALPASISSKLPALLPTYFTAAKAARRRQ